jgi:hypothetical protein
MNWEAIGAIAESLGTVGIIASLIYVAIQIRQNTRGTRIETFESAVRGAQNQHRSLIVDPDLLRAFIAGHASYDDLGMKDRIQFHGYMINWLLEYQLFKRSFDEGAQSRASFADKSLGEFEKLMISLLRTPGGQAWWAGETYLNPSTRAEIDSLMAENPDVRFGEGAPYFGLGNKEDLPD